MRVRMRVVHRLAATLLLGGLLLARCGAAPAGNSAAAGPATPAAAAAFDAEALMADVRALAAPEMEGRGAGTPGGVKARAYLVDRFRAVGLEPLADGYLAPFEFTARLSNAPAEGANIVGRCPGRDPGAPVLVVSAHYDHLGVRLGVIFPGADDNASGVAVLLALAAECRRAPFRRTVLFAAFDAEEHGLRGARAFVAAPPVPRARIALNVNLDMVSRGDKGELYAAGTFHTPALRAPLEAVAARAPIALRFGHDRPEDGQDDWTLQSDHGAFHEAGIPFVYFGVEDHPDYHQPTDTADRIDPTFFAAAARTILDAVRALDAFLAGQ